MEALFKYLSKDFIRGLGIGFLISAMLVITYPEVQNNIKPLSDDEIKSKAKELGMVEKKVINNKIVNRQVQNPQPKVLTPPVTKKPIKINIPKGSTLLDIADILYKNGAIADKKKFVNLVDKLKLATKFHTGNYVIPANAETLDIITLMSK